MARAIDSRFYKNSQWIKCRESFLKEHPLCELCLKNGDYVPSKYVHHKIELNEDNVTNPKITYNFENLQALCFDCHEKQHRNKSKRRYKINKDGSITIL